jgi:hypothetical protein
MKVSKFSVGEQVILQDQGYDGYNGEYVVHKVVCPQMVFKDRRWNCERYNVSKEEFGYLLNEIHPSFKNPKGEILWAESSLRKKYKPSEKSFDQLISEIKCPSNIA